MKSVVCAALYFGLALPALADSELVVDLSDASRTMHPTPEFRSVPIEPAFEDYQFMLFDICDAVAIDCLIYPMMGRINNAVAYQNSEGMRIIVYDRTLSPTLGYVGANAVLAHEVGHHFCGHLVQRSNIARHEAEAEADRFMGFAMARLGTKLSDLIAAYETLGIDEGSSSHPAMSRRAQEIAAGYYAKSLSEVCPGMDPK